MAETFYLTTTLPYVNPEPHIGFAFEIVQADIVARYKRMMGAEVFFSTGTDKHGQKIFQKAREEGRDVSEHVDHFALHSRLVRIQSSPVVELNRAVAVAMRDGPEFGLTLIDAVLARGELANYHLAHSARADLCRRLGRMAEARSSYEKALALTQQEPERRFLEERLRQLDSILLD
jgi:hypothetical protein